MTPANDSAHASDPGTSLPETALDAKGARVIDVFFPPGSDPVVDMPVAVAYAGDLLMWRAAQSGAPGFAVVFEAGGSGDVPAPCAAAPFVPDDEESRGGLDGKIVSSRTARVAGLKIGPDMPLKSYAYAVVRTEPSPDPSQPDPPPPPPPVYPFIVIIRQPRSVHS